jgi:4-amino-4-deoxy-L-arabinose transferase-like glycosyltransferase
MHGLRLVGSMKPHALQKNTDFHIPLWLVWITALACVLAGLGSVGILDNNEGLYAEIPREMLASHDWRQWVIPHLNGLPYMEKPPLLYWLTAFSFSLFGESEWSARLVPALSSLACVAMLVWFGDAVKRRLAGRLAALMFVTGMGVSVMSHVLMFDMLLTALLTAALMCAYRYFAEERVRFLRLSAVFLALALLAKGFVALVLFGLVMTGFMLMTSGSPAAFWIKCKKWGEPRAILIFFAIAVPWHLAASLTEPIFAWFYFINEHVLRFLGKREPHDYYAGAWWYYLPRMAIYLFPWSFLLPCLLRKTNKDKGAEQAGLHRFLWLAWLMPLVFFSISSAKANYYLVVVMPFAAFHLALAIEQQDFFRGWIKAIPGILIGMLAAGACVALLMRGVPSESALLIVGLTQHTFLLGLFTGLAILAAGCAVAAWRMEKNGILAYLALPLWTGSALFMVWMAMEPSVSTKQMAHYLQTEHAGHTVYLYRDFEQRSSLPFYLKMPVQVIDSRSNDLFWGNRLRMNNDIVLSEQQFGQHLQQRPVAVMVRDYHLRDFRATRFFAHFKGEKRIGDSTVFFN